MVEITGAAAGPRTLQQIVRDSGTPTPPNSAGFPMDFNGATESELNGVNVKLNRLNGTNLTLTTDNQSRIVIGANELPANTVQRITQNSGKLVFNDIEGAQFSRKNGVTTITLQNGGSYIVEGGANVILSVNGKDMPLEAAIGQQQQERETLAAANNPPTPTVSELEAIAQTNVDLISVDPKPTRADLPPLTGFITTVSELESARTEPSPVGMRTVVPEPARTEPSPVGMRTVVPEPARPEPSPVGMRTVVPEPARPEPSPVGMRTVVPEPARPEPSPVGMRTVVPEPARPEPSPVGMRTVVPEPARPEPSPVLTTIEMPPRERPPVLSTIEMPPRERPPVLSTIEMPPRENPPILSTIEMPPRENPPIRSTIEMPPRENPPTRSTIDMPKPTPAPHDPGDVTVKKYTFDIEQLKKFIPTGGLTVQSTDGRSVMSVLDARLSADGKPEVNLGDGFRSAEELKFNIFHVKDGHQYAAENIRLNEEGLRTLQSLTPRTAEERNRFTTYGGLTDSTLSTTVRQEALPGNSVAGVSYEVLLRSGVLPAGHSHAGERQTYTYSDTQLPTGYTGPVIPTNTRPTAPMGANNGVRGYSK